VTVLRRALTDFLQGSDLSADERYDLLLAVCEAASNAIEHALNPTEPFFEVLTEIGGARVTVVVRDHGQWCHGPPGVDRGRGLAMMWMLADSTVTPSPRGTTVTIHSSPRHRQHAVAPHGERRTPGARPHSSSTAGGA
jgi:anti-sigma regulatory factor (Ser/Thr protein kinase)